MMPFLEQGRPISQPCADPTCRTQGGFTPHDRVTPRRSRGLCNTCYARHFHAGTLDRFPMKPQADIARHAPTHHPAPHSRYATRVRNRRERKVEREREIAARVARHQARTWSGYANPNAPASSTEATARATQSIVNAEQFAAEWLAEHPEYHARWTRKDAA